MAQQKVGHPGVERFGLLRYGVQIVQHGAVAVRLGKIAVIGFGADGSAMAQVIVAGDQDALRGQILCQWLVAVNELDHAMG